MINIICNLITAISVISVAIIQKKGNKKLEKIEDIKESCQKMMDKHILENDKTYLTDFLSEVEKGVEKSEIQVQRASEIKKEYNSLGGDSYVDEKWEYLKKEGMIKL